MKIVGMLRKVKLRGIDKVGWVFTFTGAAYQLLPECETSMAFERDTATD